MMARNKGHITRSQKSYLEDLIAKLYERYPDVEQMEGALPETLRSEGRWGIANCSKAAASERIDQAKAMLATAKQSRRAQKQRPASPRTVEQRMYRASGSREALYDLNPMDPMAERI